MSGPMDALKGCSGVRPFGFHKHGPSNNLLGPRDPTIVGYGPNGAHIASIPTPGGPYYPNACEMTMMRRREEAAAAHANYLQRQNQGKQAPLFSYRDKPSPPVIAKK